MSVPCSPWGRRLQQCRISNVSVAARVLNPIHSNKSSPIGLANGNAIRMVSLKRDEGRERLVAVKSSDLPSTGTQKRKEDIGDSDCITATIEKPLGLVIAENKSGVVIESIEPGGNADRLGVFCVGDLVVSCSAIVMKMAEGENASKKESIYKGNRKGGCCSTGCSDCPFNAKNWVQVQFDCRGESFDAVVAALSSNTNARWMRQYGMKNNITISVVRGKKESIS